MSERPEYRPKASGETWTHYKERIASDQRAEIDALELFDDFARWTVENLGFVVPNQENWYALRDDVRREVASLQQRLESAEKENERLRRDLSDEHDAYHQIGDAYEAQKALVAAMVESDIELRECVEQLGLLVRPVLDALGPCDHFDHNGDCQAHFVSKPCPVGVLARYLEGL